MSAPAEALSVRRAIAADAPELARMRADSSYERKGGERGVRAAHVRVCEDFFARELADPDSFLHTFVATIGERVVGGASLTIVPTLPRYGIARPCGFDGRVRDVYVEPDFRKRGIARALMAAVMEDAEREGLDRLTLGASEMGMPLYLKLGFTFKRDEMVFDR